MRWYGKVLGFIAGWLLMRHPAGGLIGLAIGHAFDAGWFWRKGPDPYRELGVDEQASDEDVDLAYRRLIAQYHPDRVAGAAKELQDHATARATRINAAYRKIKELRRRAD